MEIRRSKRSTDRTNARSRAFAETRSKKSTLERMKVVRLLELPIDQGLERVGQQRGRREMCRYQRKFKTGRS